ncbi:hypothetical protein BsWGS_18985 [Bradybaena similaris]
MEKKSAKTSKDKNKTEVLSKRPVETANVNQNVASSGPASVAPSAYTVSDFTRIKVSAQPSFKKLSNTQQDIIADNSLERKARKQEMTEIQALWEKNILLMKEFTEAKIVKAKWDRYMRCDGSPDPVNQREINTYISLREEDTSRDDAASVFEDSRMDLQLIRELDFLLLNSPEDLMCEEERSIHKQTIDELRRLIMSKLDMATLQVMCDATVLAHKETGNLQYGQSIGDITLCIWGNIMKNQRIRSFEFEVFNYSFDIPKTLALTDCAVRILATRFDNYSPTSRTMAPRLKVEAKLELLEAEAKDVKIGEDADKDPDATSKENTEEELVDKPSSMFKLNTTAASDDELADDQRREDESLEVVDEDYPDPPTPEPAEYEEFLEEEDVVDLRAYSILGRIYHLDLLQLPPQPRIAGSWTITQLVEPPKISFLEYTADSARDSITAKEGRNIEKPPISVSLVLPDDVLTLQQPRVAFWDPQREVWSNKAISEVTYTGDPPTVTFKIHNFGVLCLLEEKHINLPFSWWIMRPHAVNTAVLTIASPFVEIEIEIKNELCCLSGPKIRPELTSIRDHWVTPSELIQMMTNAGLNFFPSEDSLKFVNVQRKNPLIEERSYQQMALTASAMAFTWSKWNQHGTNSDEIVFMGAEALADEPIPEDAWSAFVATKTRVTTYTDTESDDHSAIREKSTPDNSGAGSAGSAVVAVSSKPSKSLYLRRVSSTKSGRRSKLLGDNRTPRDQFLDNFAYQTAQFKSNIYHLVTSTGSEPTLAKISNTSFQFVNCVYKLLTATRILSYS